MDELDERLPQFDQQLRLHVTGCPNGCGQHWIADIGIEGKKIKHEGKLTDAYYFCLGGAVGQYAGVARPVGYRCPAPLVPEAIERLLRAAGRFALRYVRGVLIVFLIPVSPATLDVLVLFTIGTVNVIGILWRPDYALEVTTISIALTLLLVILR